MEIRYLLGQTIKLYESSGDYDLVRIHIPCHTSGPPPHLHSNITELILVVGGELEFRLGNDLMVLKTGDYVDIPANVVLTFNNTSDQECQLISIHAPAGFAKFFQEFGILAEEPNALERSNEPNIVSEIIRMAADFDMEIHM